MKIIDGGVTAAKGFKAAAAAAEMAEFMFLGLRMTRGISKAEFERQFGSEIDAIYGDVLRKYKSMGLLLEENGRIFLSREGIHVSNSVMADFLP